MYKPDTWFIVCCDVIDLVVKVLAMSINSRFQAVKSMSVVRTGVKRRARRGGLRFWRHASLALVGCLVVVYVCFFLIKER